MDEGLGGSQVKPARPAPSSGGSASAKLEVRGISYRYGTTTAVDGVDLSIGEGEFVAILGPSGCGKTTLLRIVAGLLHPVAGSVFLDAEDITARPPEKRPLSMVFQHLALFPHLSVADNVGFSLSLRRWPKRRISERVDPMLRLVGLSGVQSRSVHQLSGGQQQRVALARALITEPEILLLDEPLGALDLAIRKEMQHELKALQRRLNITFVYVTHDQTEAMTMSDRIVLMRGGRIVQDAPPVEAYLNPTSVFAASFVGDTNLLRGTVTKVSSAECRIAVGEYELTLPVRQGVNAGSDVVVSIRPEHLRVTESEEAHSLFPGTIASRSFLGPDVLLDVATPAGTVRVRHAVGSDGIGWQGGAEVYVSYDAQRARLFSADDQDPDG